jgi:hypothetical protein
MTAASEYIAARRVLVDALDALNDHLRQLSTADALLQSLRSCH